MPSSPPSVGRTVHYVSFGTPGGEYTSECRAAVVTEVGVWVDLPGTYSEQVMDGERFRTVTQVWGNDACALTVLNPTGMFFKNCSHDEAPKVGGTWHWPCVRT